ncbi:hypothetical protein X971_3449 [Agrobacterium tumefaciens LBA4213 (Ach5)]|nr:hypothetical protein X971_3449 [Agrobacterium tumefaciens LBA4213 (Ach5)]
MQVSQRSWWLQCHTCMHYLSTCMIICITCWGGKSRAFARRSIRRRI